MKRLFIDIETSPDVVYSWRTGYKLNIGTNAILEERKIICISYKWQGDKKCTSLTWDKSKCDRKMIQAIAKVLAEADEVVGHNADNFDIKWIRTRAAFHGIKLTPLLKGFDTLKVARAAFYFNSNRMDYVAKLLGVGSKINTTYSLWKDVMVGSKAALRKMVKYCEHDVEVVEKVFNKLMPYVNIKTHAGVHAGGAKFDCPECASENTHKRGFRTSAVGDRRQIVQCMDCTRYFTVARTVAAKMRRTK